MPTKGTRAKIPYLMRKIKIIFFLGGALLLLNNCRNMNAMPADYMRYVEDAGNGLRIEKKMGQVKFTAQYKPYEYILLKETKARPNTEEELQTNLKELSGYEYITFNIGAVSGKSSPIEKKDNNSEYFQRLSYCTSELQNDFLLIDGDDTLPCKMYQFERNYGMGPSNNILLGFQQKKPKEIHDKTLLFFDRLFQSGLLKFNIRASDIKQVPYLKAY
jgi:hypothetical protein